MSLSVDQREELLSVLEIRFEKNMNRRYNTVFTYHNGAESYYGARGFRGVLRV